jgi:hypothetical protein
LLENSGFAFWPICSADGCPILARFLRKGGIPRYSPLKVFAFALDFVFDFAFGWRSAGVPITPGFGVMGWSGLPLR